ncbi:hypothetical protein [Methanobrevibacter sp.]|uniref:hypothetical protein n=1 Tax=Methanobrevibacter sp. TaxID=66852 RepID=UPI00388DAFC4
MKFICPAIGEDHEKDFLVVGKIDDFKIVAFTDIAEYEKGVKYLELSDDYAPCEVSAELFVELSKKDDEFTGIILNIHSENRSVTKKEILEESF